MNDDFAIASYDYHLPQTLIAQEPASSRDQSRLLVLDCPSDSRRDLRFTDIIHFLKPGDLVVANDTRVFPARLYGRKTTGGKVELLLLEFPSTLHSQATGKTTPAAQAESGSWRTGPLPCLMKASKRLQPGGMILFGDDLTGTITEALPDGKVMVSLYFEGRLQDCLDRHGQMPLPPYINRENGETPSDRSRYQTLYASQTGAVAAPTAGLHFSDSLLETIRGRGIDFCTITLHVGYGTFAPVRVDDIRQHRIHQEYIAISEEAAAQINRTRKSGGRIWAVGTTTVRALEFAATTDGTMTALDGWCDHYIIPGYRFRVIDNLITNFHLPKSSLLFLVSALTGRQRLLQCYTEAISLGYRFYSYGDAMAIIGCRH